MQEVQKGTAWAGAASERRGPSKPSMVGLVVRTDAFTVALDTRSPAFQSFSQSTAIQQLFKMICFPIFKRNSIHKSFFANQRPSFMGSMDYCNDSKD